MEILVIIRNLTSIVGKKNYPDKLHILIYEMRKKYIQEREMKCGKQMHKLLFFLPLLEMNKADCCSLDGVGYTASH